jgi:CDP-glucose 4,6-dehydratase
VGKGLTAFYAGKKVLVTGHTGFKGSWLSYWLNHLGSSVAGYSLAPSTEPNLFSILDLHKITRHSLSDVRDLDALISVVGSFKPEIIFHLAAQPIVRYSYAHPAETFETNLMGTVNLLEAARLSESVRAVVCITTDKCYENREWVYGYRENDPMGGYDPYSASKGCAELAIASYRRSFFNSNDPASRRPAAVASARAGNVIGGGDWSVDRLVPDCVRSITENREIVLRSPDAVRPWQHVLEPLYGYLLLAMKMHEEPESYAEAWNFGPSDADVMRVEDVVSAVIRVWGRGYYSIEAKQNFHEAQLLKLDISKARFKLNWNPVWCAAEAISKTVEWYRAFYDKSDMHALCLEQIENYCARFDASNNT